MRTPGVCHHVASAAAGMPMHASNMPGTANEDVLVNTKAPIIVGGFVFAADIADKNCSSR